MSWVKAVRSTVFHATTQTITVKSCHRGLLTSAALMHHASLGGMIHGRSLTMAEHYVALKGLEIHDNGV